MLSNKIRKIAKDIVAAKWLYKLDLSDFWKNKEELGAQEVAQKVAERLNLIIEKMDKDPKVKDFIDELIDIHEEMQTIGEDEGAQDEDFNDLFERLYDVADSTVEKKNFYNDEKLIWVKTI